MNQVTRNIPLDAEWMENVLVDYKLYGWFQKQSFFSPTGGERFVYKSHSRYGKLTQARIREIYNDMSKSKDKLGLSTIQKRMRLFKEIGMMEEGKVMDQFGNEVSAYILPEAYKVFQIVPIDTLEYLVNTSNSTVIKIYAYLLNKHEGKQMHNDLYVFTYGELAKAVGMPDNNNGNTKIMRDCIASLMNSGLIECVQFYTKTPKGLPSPRMRLVKANKSHKNPVA